MIVATAGHIDHGKTTLVRALTGVDTDRLPEEKARGISIDLGFAYWRTPGDGLTVGFVDVPGHERFVRNMLAGVCGIDFVLIVVAADDGVMPQTVEHLHIVDLLSVRRGIAVLTKADRVPPERLRAVADEVRALLAPTGLAGIPVLPVSALTGDGMDALRGAIADAARARSRALDAGRGLRFAVDRAFTIAGSGTVATGTVFHGALAVGDRLMLTPRGVEVRVRGIHKDGKAATGAAAGERCALNLSGVERADVARGDWVVAPALHAPTERLDVRLTVLATEPRPLAHWTPVHLHHGAGDVTARVALRRGAVIAPGATGVARLVLDAPVAALNGDRFVVRDQSAQRTIGGGVVLDPFAPRARRHPEERAAQLAAMAADDPAAALAGLAAAAPAGVDLGWFARAYNLDDARLAALLPQCALAVLGREPAVAFPAAAVEAVKAEVARKLTALHDAAPQAQGFEMAAVRAACAPRWSAASFGALLRVLGEARVVELSGSTVRLARREAVASAADQRLWQAVRPRLAAAGLNGLTIAELAAAAAVKDVALRDFLHRQARSGATVRVTPERFYLRETMAQFVAAAQAAARIATDGRFSAAQVRDAAGIGRNRAIELLEALDRLGVTQRIGEVRILRREAVGLFGAAPPLAAPAAPAAPGRPAVPAAPGRPGAAA
ncbi:MAG: selenocysteine-specific translation elongation factor, partial [Burkholderiales bacterium]|nr:selenocysteine-specific translation elongation factor [Burkholderiales bacterium]